MPSSIDREGQFGGSVGNNAVARLHEEVVVEHALADMRRVPRMVWETFSGGPMASTSNPMTASRHYDASKRGLSDLQ